MNSNEVEHILHTLQPVPMAAEEKARIRAALSSHIDAHPAPAADERRAGGLLASPFMSEFKNLTFLSRKMTAMHMFEGLAVALLIVLGSVSAAAQGALPGEPLYAVKVNINEQVSGAFAFSPQAKAQHEASLAATRLDEAVDLSAQGKLTPQARAQIEANLQTHVDNVEKNVDKLTSQDDARGAIEVSSDLASTLNAHEQVMQSLSSGSDEAGSVAAAIRLQLSGVSDQLGMLEQQVTDEVSIDSEDQAHMKSGQAESAILSAKDDYAAAQGSVSAEVLSDANQRITSALNYLSDGYASMGNGAFNKAFINFQTAIRYSKEARVIIAAGKNLNIPGTTTPSDDGEGTSTATSTASTTDETATSTASTTEGADGSGTSATGTSATSTASTTFEGFFSASGTENVASSAADALIRNKLSATSTADFSRSTRQDIISNLLKSASSLGF